MRCHSRAHQVSSVKSQSTNSKHGNIMQSIELSFVGRRGRRGRWRRLLLVLFVVIGLHFSLHFFLMLSHRNREIYFFKTKLWNTKPNYMELYKIMVFVFFKGACCMPILPSVERSYLHIVTLSVSIAWARHALHIVHCFYVQNRPPLTPYFPLFLLLFPC